MKRRSSTNPLEASSMPLPKLTFSPNFWPLHLRATSLKMHCIGPKTPQMSHLLWELLHRTRTTHTLRPHGGNY